jgi:hypothetical protein
MSTSRKQRMALFQKAPEKQMAADIGAKIIERDKLVGRLADAENAVDTATLAATALAVDGATDDVLDKAESKLRALSDRVTTLRAALVKLGTTIVGLENAYAEHQDKTRRRETARQCEKMADDLEEVAKDIDPIFERMVEITSRAAAGQIWDAAGLHSYAESSKGQIPAAIAAVAQAIRQHGIRVVANMERATLLQAEAPRATVAVVEPVVSRVFTLQNVKWTDHDGRLMTISKFADVDLPVETAKRALASRACAPTDSDVRRQWAGNRAVTHPPADECVSIDGADIVKLDTPIVDATFTRIDRGSPYQASIRKA